MYLHSVACYPGAVPCCQLIWTQPSQNLIRNLQYELTPRVESYEKPLSSATVLFRYLTLSLLVIH